jgi:hypothetical protein
MTARRVFLSGMIDGVALSEASRWRQHATDVLAGSGFETYDPTRVMVRAGEKYGPAPIEVFTNDRWNLERCDVVLANLDLPPTLETANAPFFTIGELFLAHALHLPIITFGAAFRGRAGYEAIVTRSFDELDDALTYIVEHYGTPR